MHHQTLQASSSFSTPYRKPLDRPVSKIPQRALHKQAQTSNITNLFKKFITTIRLKGTALGKSTTGSMPSLDSDLSSNSNHKEFFNRDFLFDFCACHEVEQLKLEINI